MTHRCRDAPAVAERSGWTFGGSILLLLLIALCGAGGALDTEAVQAAVPADSVVRSGPGPATSAPTPSLWYQSRWAWAAYGGVVVGVAIFLGMWRRTVVLQRQRDELQRELDEQGQDAERQILDLKHHARKLVRTNEALRETAEEKTTLLETVSHDLKNPLFAIWALSEIMIENEILSSRAKRKIGLIRQSAAEGQDLIDELLSSGAGTQETEHDTSIVDIGDLVHWVVQRFEPHADWKNQQLHCTVKVSDPCLVEGNRRRLREALSNLLNNALKYSPPEARIDVILERTENDVRVAVADEGPGLNDEDQTHLFAPFRRLSPQPTGGESSSGLGLYLVKQIIDRHQGRVDVDSAPGEGSTFSIVVPAAPSNSAPESEQTGPEQTETLSSAGLPKVLARL